MLSGCQSEWQLRLWPYQGFRKGETPQQQPDACAVLRLRAQLRPALSALDRGGLVASASADATVRLWRPAAAWACARIFCLPAAAQVPPPLPRGVRGAQRDLAPHPFLSVAMSARRAWAVLPQQKDLEYLPLSPCMF